MADTPRSTPPAPGFLYAAMRIFDLSIGEMLWSRRTIFLALVVGPYRRGDVATWWGILASVLVLAAVAGARVVFTHVPTGTGEPLVVLAVVLVALLLDVRRLTAAR